MSNSEKNSRLMVRSFCLAGALVSAAAAYGQSIITTVAGGGFANNAPALQSHIGSPAGVAADASGNLFIAAMGRILRVDSGGTLSAVAGGGSTLVDTGDGPALTVRILPTNLLVEKTGNVLFLDSSTLRRLDLQKATIATIAGRSGVNGSTGDGGAAVNAELNSPQQICLDSAGDIHVVELAGRVRRIDAKTLVITTVAGNGGLSFGGDGGLATAATLFHPTGVAVDSAGNLYISDTGDSRIRKVDAATQIITTIAGTGHGPASGDGGSAANASFDGPGQIAVDSHDNVYVLDQNRVRRIDAGTGVISAVAGNGQAALAGDGGPAAQAQVSLPGGLAFDAAGDLLIADTGNRRIRMVAAASGIITTVAGTSDNGDGGLAAGAVLNFPVSVAVDSAGDLYIASGNLIRKVTHATGVISTFAGGGASTADGVPALQAQLSPLSLAFDSAGNLYVGEASRVRKISTAGTVSTIAGTGVQGFSGDNGPAKSAKVSAVNGVAVDSAGNVLIGDSGNKRVRRIDGGTSVITTIAGNGQKDLTAVGIAATQAAIGAVSAVAADGNGNVFIAALNNYRVLKVSSAGILSVAAGNGGCGYIGDGGPATAASLCQPSAIALDGNGNMFVGDTYCYCVRRNAPDGTIQTVAGTGNKGHSGDNGPATLGQFQSVASVAVSGTTLYIADPQSGVVRGVSPDTPPALPGTPSFSPLVSSASFLAGPIAPGELVSLFGHYLGPAKAALLTIGPDGKVTNQLGGVQVFFDDVPATLIYVAAGQINAIVPYAVGNDIHSVRVVAPGGSASISNVPTSGSAPAVFPNAIVNHDGTLNSAAHPAPKGSVVVMYGTGLGQTVSAGVDGSVTPLTNYPKQATGVQLTVSTNPLFELPIPVTASYAGPAPGLVAGVFQINARIPTNASSGQNLLQITSGQTTSPPTALFIQ